MSSYPIVDAKPKTIVPRKYENQTVVTWSPLVASSVNGDPPVRKVGFGVVHSDVVLELADGSIRHVTLASKGMLKLNKKTQARIHPKQDDRYSGSHRDDNGDGGEDVPTEKEDEEDMSTQPNTPPAPAKTRTKGDGTIKSFGVSLRDPAGAKLYIYAKRNKNGTATVAVKHSVRDKEGNKIVKRGASTEHANLDVARTAVDALVKDAKTNGGWVGTSRQGFAGRRSREDDFDVNNIPKASKAAPPVINTPKKS